MCGRFAISATLVEIEQYLSVSVPISYQPNYNVSPSQEIYGICSDDPHTVTTLQWGFTPQWADSETFKSKPINARLESIAQKHLFRDAFKNFRCIIIASGYYEWKENLFGKQPYYFYVKNIPILPIAGLWSQTKTNGKKTCTLIVQSAERKLAQIHNRRPVVLHSKSITSWLDTKHKNPHELLVKLEAWKEPEEAFSFYPVSKKINRPIFNEPTCIEPILLQD